MPYLTIIINFQISKWAMIQSNSSNGMTLMARFCNLQRCEGMWMRESKKLIDSEITKVEKIVFADSGLVMSK